MQETHYRLLKNIGNGFSAGETRPIADFKDCDVNWLKSQGAIVGCGPEPAPVMAAPVPAPLVSPVIASLQGQAVPQPGVVNFGNPQAEYDARMGNHQPSQGQTFASPALMEAFKEDITAAVEATAMATAKGFQGYLEGVREELTAAMQRVTDRVNDMDRRLVRFMTERDEPKPKVDQNLIASALGSASMEPVQGDGVQQFVRRADNDLTDSAIPIEAETGCTCPADAVGRPHAPACPMFGTGNVGEAVTSETTKPKKKK